MKVNCVVVTYNRLSLLKEGLSALEKQTYPINKIFVVDNNSTDGTIEYLNQYKNSNQFEIVLLDQNTGGAGGFSEGVKRAYLDGCDWVWLMDDDTIPNPDALEELMKGAVNIDNVGCICSRVVWTDGKLHKMNIPNFNTCDKDRTPLNYYSYIADVLLVKTASFVSLLVNSEAIKKVGLPIKEFFIWGDDVEYTSRIYDAGYLCLYSGRSVVVHKTKTNYLSCVQDITIDTLWKYEYGVRNETLLRRKRKHGIVYYISVLNSYRRTARKLASRPKKEKKIILSVLRKAYWKGISFNPTIEKV